MSEVKGVVEKVMSREVVGKYGNSMAYDIQVNGTRYGMGFSKPQCNEGDVVSFEAKKNGNFWNADSKTLVATKGEAPQTVNKSVSSAVSSQEAPQSRNARECSIQYQASRNAAIAAFQALTGADAFNWPTSAKNGSQRELYATAWIDKKTTDLYAAVKQAEAGNPPDAVLCVGPAKKAKTEEESLG